MLFMGLLYYQEHNNSKVIYPVGIEYYLESITIPNSVTFYWKPGDYAFAWM